MIYSGKAITVHAKDGGIAELCFDLKDDSVNKFNALTINELKEATAAVAADTSLKGVIVTIVYTGVLTVLLSLMVALIATRTPVILDVMRDRNALYRDVGRDGIQNSYTIRVINKHNEDHDYALSVSGVEGMRITTDTTVSVPGESVVTLPTAVIVPHEHARGGHVIEFRIDAEDESGISMTQESRFRGPTE